MIKLYGMAASRAFRNIWMLKELGLTYEHDQISYSDPKLKQAPYIELNPNGRIPFIEIDGFVLFESLAINLYLARKFPGPLTPVGEQQEAMTQQWALWAMSMMDDPMVVWGFNALVKPEPERDPAAAKAALEKMQGPLDALEASLNKHAYLLGEQFSVADLNTSAVLYRALWMDLSTRPKTKAWLNACLGRPMALEARRARGEKI